jgi:nucleoside diphosphate kinase
VPGQAEREEDGPAWGDMPVPPLDLLTADPRKRQQYTVDPLLREGWATLAGVLGAEAALRFASETAIAWLRPDAAAAGAIGDVAGRIGAAGFVAVGAAVVRLGRADVRALWWWQLQRATAERLLLLDAVAALGPGLVVLYRHPDGAPAQRLTRLKGGNDPAGRAPDSLRSVAGSPNRLLTMVHTSDDPADLVRELAVFLPWRERAALVISAWACGLPASSSVLEGPLAAVRSAYAVQASDGVPVKVPHRRGEAFAALLSDIAVPDATRRWPAVAKWSRLVPLLAGGHSR